MSRLGDGRERSFGGYGRRFVDDDAENLSFFERRPNPSSLDDSILADFLAARSIFDVKEAYRLPSGEFPRKMTWPTELNLWHNFNDFLLKVVIILKTTTRIVRGFERDSCHSPKER